MTDHTTRIHDRLAPEFDDVTVGEKLHAVPPHVVHEVTVDGRRAVCKLAVGPESVLRREAAAQAYAARETDLAVPGVLAAGEGFYVAEWLDGAPEQGGDHDLEAWAATAGAGLARLHEGASMDDHGPLRADDEGLAVAAHPTAAEGLAGYLRDLRPGVADTGYADVLDDAAGFLREHPCALAGAGDPVLCHGNWLPDHVGVADGRVAAVIDFERAVAAPAEHDYVRAALPLFLAPGRDEEPARAAFRAGYESVRPLADGFDERLDVHRLVVVASFVESLFVQDEFDPSGTRERAAALREAVDELVESLRGRLG
jgi:Ser/Thr protein kinase RdoA (MazF antagonist)